MERLIICIFYLTSVYASVSQTITIRLENAVKNLEADPQMKHAIISLYIVDGKTGKPVFDKNSQTGLAPASSQKVITSAAAFELLGSDYRYKTELSYDGKIENGVLRGNLHLLGSGDPTLGSWRFQSTKEEELLSKWINHIKNAGIKRIEGVILGDDSWGSATIPDGWIWQDIGNYYGAGASSLNWRENQYDLKLRSGNKIGDTCEMVSTSPKLYNADLICEVTAAGKGSGDNAYIYLPPYSNNGFVRGTIPQGETAFTISGSFPNSMIQLVFTLGEALNRSGINIKMGEGRTSYPPLVKGNVLSTQLSPPLDSINYWFLQKSINLYGEALIKTIGMEKGGVGTTTKGVDVIKYFWSQRGIDKSAINIVDGSGLSPQNRVTTDALVKVMQYARSSPWFNSFYNALPDINSIRMKSGSIGGAKSYTGYIKSKDGKEYTFAVIVNNYDGSAGEMVRKMWRVLDVLK